jgi:transcriptional regulator with XRE-family HTH domain
MYHARNVSCPEQTLPTLKPYFLPVTSPDRTRGAAFAALIREARDRKRWTQDRLVEESGLSRSTILRWEGGQVVNPKPDELRAVCTALGINPRRAAVALGYLTDEDLEPSTELRERLPADLEEVIEILRDPRIPSVAKEALMGYLRQLHTEAGGTPSDRRKVG